MKIPKEILASIDFMNTVQGGRIEPNVATNHNEEGFEVLVKLPTVNPDKVHVEIVENRLWIYYLLPVLTRTQEPLFSPYTVANLLLPPNVDREETSAKYHENQWRIFMPNNNITKGSRRIIDIQR